jgi:hypothetical protein
MPVIDTPVHPLTVGGEIYEACQNKKRVAGYWAPDREYLPDGRWINVQRWIPNEMSKLCRYDMSLSDRKCRGCKQIGLGEKYADDVRSKGR